MDLVSSLKRSVEICFSDQPSLAERPLRSKYRATRSLNNLSFIVTDKGVIVINASDNALMTEALHWKIKEITYQPLCYVVLETGQGHAMLGTDYWQQQGDTVIANADAAMETDKRGEGILKRMQHRNRGSAIGTRLVLSDETFDDSDITGCLDSWPLFADLNTTLVIPGHGEATDMAEVARWTRDYL